MTKNRSVRACLLAIPLAVPLTTAYSAPGDLDLTFSGDGKDTFKIVGSDNFEIWQGVAFQSDGKTVLVGRGTNRGYLARYNDDGTLDTTFGGAGTVTISAPGWGATNTQSVVIQPDGKIVTTGLVGTPGQVFSSNTMLARFLPNGDLDSTFGIDGFAIYNNGGDEHLAECALQSDGKIVGVGQIDTNTIGNGLIYVARFNDDGSPDLSFNGTGFLKTVTGGSFPGPRSVVIQPDDDKIVLAMRAITGGSHQTAVMRVNGDGTLDTGFGGGGTGWVITDVGPGNEFPWDVALQPDDGKIVVAMNVGTDFGLARYDANGVLDPTFGVGGAVVTDLFGLTEGNRSVSIQPDGKIVTAGSFRRGDNTNDFTVVRYDSAGALDATFGSGGIAIAGFADAAATTGALGPDGRIFVAGSTVPNPRFLAVARFEGGGSSDTTPPEIECPSDIEVDAESLSGAVVTFSASATDNTDPSPTVVCVPDSGSLFPVGETTVTCTATDADGNESSCQFTVTVRSPGEMLDILIGTVEDLPIRPGVKNGLLVKLLNAASKLENGETVPGINMIEAFKNLVEAQRDKALTGAEADDLIGQACAIIAALGAGSPPAGPSAPAASVNFLEARLESNTGTTLADPGDGLLIERYHTSGTDPGTSTVLYLRWNGTGVLEMTNDPGGEWADGGSPPSPYFFETLVPEQFFRIRRDE